MKYMIQTENEAKRWKEKWKQLKIYCCDFTQSGLSLYYLLINDCGPQKSVQNTFLPLKKKTSMRKCFACLQRTSRLVLFPTFESPSSPCRNFWALREPSLCSSRRKTAATRWRLWTFHLPTIPRWSESSVWLSKSLSVFNLDCSSGLSLIAATRRSRFLSPWLDFIRCERFWWDESWERLGC